MKKFLLSLCVLAVASACVFMTSCKDEDDNATNNEGLFTLIASKLDPSCTYTFTFGGKTYSTVEDLVQALAEQPAGTAANVTINATTPDGQKKTGSISGTIAAPGKTSDITYDIPQRGNPKQGHMTVTWNTTVTPTDDIHNGGAAGN